MAGTAVIVIGGAGAHQAEIFVNGERRGFAPKTLELPLGTHAFKLVAPDGHVLQARNLELTARHTHNAPYRWIIR